MKHLSTLLSRSFKTSISFGAALVAVLLLSAVFAPLHSAKAATLQPQTTFEATFKSSAEYPVSGRLAIFQNAGKCLLNGELMGLPIPEEIEYVFRIGDTVVTDLRFDNLGGITKVLGISHCEGDLAGTELTITFKPEHRIIGKAVITGAE